MCATIPVQHVSGAENVNRKEQPMSPRILRIAATLLFSAAMVAQSVQVAQDTPFQVRYAVNLNVGDSIVNVINSGASATVPGTFGAPADGGICVNVYVFDAVEQMQACCSCFVSANGFASLSVNRDLIRNTLTGVVPTSVVIKLLATRAAASRATACTINTASQAGNRNNQLVPGMAAYGTTLHAIGSTVPPTYAVSETKFTPATLSDAELTTITRACGLINTNGSGFGICTCGQLGSGH
jgi:hypothetical protein